MQHDTCENKRIRRSKNVSADTRTNFRGRNGREKAEEGRWEALRKKWGHKAWTSALARKEPLAGVAEIDGYGRCTIYAKVFLSEKKENRVGVENRGSRVEATPVANQSKG